MQPSFLRVRIVVGGIVQGVGFRNFVFHWAKKLGVNGFTRNLPTGEVEMSRAPRIPSAVAGKTEDIVRAIRDGVARRPASRNAARSDSRSSRR